MIWKIHLVGLNPSFLPLLTLNEHQSFAFNVSQLIHWKDHIGFDLLPNLHFAIQTWLFVLFLVASQNTDGLFDWDVVFEQTISSYSDFSLLKWLNYNSLYYGFWILGSALWADNDGVSPAILAWTEIMRIGRLMICALIYAETPNYCLCCGITLMAFFVSLPHLLGWTWSWIAQDEIPTRPKYCYLLATMYTLVLVFYPFDSMVEVDVNLFHYFTVVSVCDRIDV